VICSPPRPMTGTPDLLYATVRTSHSSQHTQEGRKDRCEGKEGFRSVLTETWRVLCDHGGLGGRRVGEKEVIIAESVLT
jgi:hypothetical protein